TLTATASTIPRKPGLLTERSWLDRALAREWPRLRIWAPQRRSSASSRPISSVPPAWTTVSRMSRREVPAGLERRPASSVAGLVKGAEVRILLVASVPEGRGHRAAAAREPRSPQQGQHLLP